MAEKCVHKGCGKTFTDPEEDCIYHSGPPIFHEGQKGWKCCKPRVLTFDEFLSIPPCRTGKHSTADDTAVPEPAVAIDEDERTTAPKTKPITPIPSDTASPRAPQPSQPSPPAPLPAEPESSSDNAALSVPPNVQCRRRACNARSSASPNVSRENEECVYHPGHALFHEGSKGWTCCKRRVLEFDEFMRIEGCKRKNRHLFIGSGRKTRKDHEEERVDNVRHDFYQTPSTVHASIYLKGVLAPKSTISFSSTTSLALDLHTKDQKRYETTIPFYGPIDIEKSSWKIMGTKVDFTLLKLDGASWPVLRGDEKRTGGIIQVGRAGRA